jgi:hypothetical protein
MAEINSSTAIYKDIEGYPDYRIGDDGSVISKRRYGVWKPLKPCRCGVGFRSMYVALYSGQPGGKGTKTLVHRLVLETFLGPCPEGMECCHNNGNSLDNRLSNLRWDTHVSNLADRKKHGTYKTGERHHRSKLLDAEIEEIIKLRSEGWKLSALGRRFSVSRQTVWRHCLTRRKLCQTW